ncbi:MAG: ABC transporter ATP-binding protein [Lachnospiraceae bacterium]|nr:ABC transporter ATP-binding protein [Lachnospiraceae bacterium]
MAERNDKVVGKIQIKHVKKKFINPDGSEVIALNDVNLDVEPGSFVSLIGPSGCGKTTLLRAIAGLDLASEGSVELDGNQVTEPGYERGYAFQQPTLFQWLNIRQNIAFGLKARSVYKKNKEEVDKFIKLVGLEGFEKSYPHQLSGGMCQRASLARALVGHPKVLLLDEPLGALDAFTRMKMQDEILNIWKEHKMTMMMVTHDVDEAVYMSDKIVVMSARPAKVEKVMKIDLSRPRLRGQDAFLKYRTEILEILDFAGHLQEAEYFI